MRLDKGIGCDSQACSLHLKPDHVSCPSSTKAASIKHTQNKKLGSESSKTTSSRNWVSSIRSRFRTLRTFIHELEHHLPRNFRVDTHRMQVRYASSPSRHPGTIPQSQETAQRYLIAFRRKVGRAWTCGTCCRARNACKPGSKTAPVQPETLTKSLCGMLSGYRQLQRR